MSTAARLHASTPPLLHADSQVVTLSHALGFAGTTTPFDCTVALGSGACAHPTTMIAANAAYEIVKALGTRGALPIVAMHTPSLLTLATRAQNLAEDLAHFVEFATESFRNRDPGRMRRAPYLAARVRALAAALDLADDDDILTIANELTDLEMLAETVLPREAPTLRPPPKASGTFLIEVRTAATNRILVSHEASDGRNA